MCAKKKHSAEIWVISFVAKYIKCYKLFLWSSQKLKINAQMFLSAEILTYKIDELH